MHHSLFFTGCMKVCVRAWDHEMTGNEVMYIRFHVDWPLVAFPDLQDPDPNCSAVLASIMMVLVGWLQLETGDAVFAERR
jgi:hypothetical protein